MGKQAEQWRRRLEAGDSLEVISREEPYTAHTIGTAVGRWCAWSGAPVPRTLPVEYGGPARSGPAWDQREFETAIAQLRRDVRAASRTAAAALWTLDLPRRIARALRRPFRRR